MPVSTSPATSVEISPISSLNVTTQVHAVDGVAQASIATLTMSEGSRLMRPMRAPFTVSAVTS